MADVTMCDNEECPLKEECYRFMAVACGLQSYAYFTPNSEYDCDYFIPLKRKAKPPREEESSAS